MASTSRPGYRRQRPVCPQTWSKSPKRSANSWLDHSQHAESGEFTDEELMTIADEDVRNSVEPLLNGLGLSVPA